MTLDNVQLASWFVQLVMEVTECCLDFINQIFLVTLRERLYKINKGICLEDTCVPCL